MAMIDYLNGIKLKGKTDLFTVAQKYQKLIGSRSMLVLVSDFLVNIENIREALLYFAGNEVVFIQVLDILEKELDLEGDFKLQDSEAS